MLSPSGAGREQCPADGGSASLPGSLGFRPATAGGRSALRTAGRSVGDDVWRCARGWVGTPFHWEAAVKYGGCDCRGLLTGIARELGRPEAAAIEANVVGYSRRIDEASLLDGLDRVFARRPEASVPEAGDVLAFRIRRKVQHLALAGPGGRMIHAYSGDPHQVVEVRLGPFWRERLAGVWAWREPCRPIPPVDEATRASSGAAAGR